jgi:hypothetical protein
VFAIGELRKVRLRPRSGHKSRVLNLVNADLSGRMRNIVQK